MAEATRTIRDRTLGPQGILELRIKYGELRERYQQGLRTNVARVKSIFELNATLIGSANVGILTAGVRFDDAANRARLMNWSSALALLSILGGAYYLIVERQINRRMRRLTQSVVAIADGQIDQPVDVAGDDELGQISRAVEVFRGYAQALTRSNTDLQVFAYAASHDLRSPLKAISHLAHWTLEDAGDELSPDNRRNLELMVNRVDRLTTLLADLLKYARIGAEASEMDRFDLNQEVQSIGELLDPDRRFDIRAVDLTGGEIASHVTPLRQILHNLVSNALKHHDLSAGSITVTAALLDGRLVVSVADDGPGIEEKYHERIFELFVTLKSRDEVEGSGLGLAYVTKLVHRYGGDIKVISDPSERRGCTFSFDFPYCDEEERISIAA